MKPYVMNLVQQLPNEQIAEAIEELDNDDAIYQLEDLQESAREKILDRVPQAVWKQIVRGLEYPDDFAGHLMR